MDKNLRVFYEAMLKYDRRITDSMYNKHGYIVILMSISIYVNEPDWRFERVRGRWQYIDLRY